MGINPLSVRMWLLNPTIPPKTSLIDEIKDIEVEMTILDGEIVRNKMG